MGWILGPARIEEDNAACVYASDVAHMTRNPRHLELTDSWIKEKVADGTCIVVKVDSVNNDSDIGTKHVPQSLFNAMAHTLQTYTLQTDTTSKLQTNSSLFDKILISLFSHMSRTYLQSRMCRGIP